MNQEIPQKYEEKFAGFIRACTKAKASGADFVIIAWPRALGDTYEEVMESLARMADTGVALRIVHR